MINMLLSLLLSIAILILAGRMTISNKWLKLDKYTPLLRTSLYFAAGTITLSLYMLLLSIFHISFSMLSVGLPFIIYFLYLIPDLIKYSVKFKFDLNIFKPKKEDTVFYVVLIIMILVVITLILSNLLLPVFRQDALGGWVYRAKVFFVEKRIALDIFEGKLFSNTADYPILYSLNLTWLAVCLNKWDDSFVRIFLSLQYVAALIIFYGFLKEQIDKNKAMIATLLVFIIPNLLSNIETAYADFSLAFYVLLSVIFFYKWLKEKNIILLILSAFFMGGAAFTKNDGISLLIALIATLCAYSLIADRKKAVKNVALFTLVSATVFIPYKIYLMFFDLKSHMVPAGNILMDIFSNLNRVPELLKFLSYELFANTYSWVYFWIYFFIFVITFRKKIVGSSLLYIFLFILFSVLGYLMVYLIVPPSVYIFAEATVSRLLLGLAPSAGFLMFTAAFSEDK